MSSYIRCRPLFFFEVTKLTLKNDTDFPFILSWRILFLPMRYMLSISVSWMLIFRAWVYSFSTFDSKSSWFFSICMICALDEWVDSTVEYSGSKFRIIVSHDQNQRVLKLIWQLLKLIETGVCKKNRRVLLFFTSPLPSIRLE